MFRALSGFKAQYHHLTLLVASDFDEWKVFLEAPGLTIQGCRQFTEEKAKKHAVEMAEHYLKEEKHEGLPLLDGIVWEPLARGEWLNWRP
ncbi:MAG TPA: hypothetical protein PLA43_05565 [Bryobacteraceae bacterium]|nr:hypothetical protein [Bryobacteraceae bacterium]HOQ45285.1 hypothetical protein [Bryobacteraceae bacterium]HPU71403.1 hypothetical protein [Bryobacteraceae bacterium]